jgi:hypothetical protein
LSRREEAGGFIVKSPASPNFIEPAAHPQTFCELIMKFEKDIDQDISVQNKITFDRASKLSAKIAFIVLCILSILFFISNSNDRPVDFNSFFKL